MDATEWRVDPSEASIWPCIWGLSQRPRWCRAALSGHGPARCAPAVGGPTSCSGHTTFIRIGILTNSIPAPESSARSPLSGQPWQAIFATPWTGRRFTAVRCIRPSSRTGGGFVWARWAGSSRAITTGVLAWEGRIIERGPYLHRSRSPNFGDSA